MSPNRKTIFDTLKFGRRADKFVQIVRFSTHNAAEFERAWPVYYSKKSYDGNNEWVLETHFRLDEASLRTRIRNLRDRYDLNVDEELSALNALISAACGR